MSTQAVTSFNWATCIAMGCAALLLGTIQFSPTSFGASMPRLSIIVGLDGSIPISANSFAGFPIVYFDPKLHFAMLSAPVSAIEGLQRMGGVRYVTVDSPVLLVEDHQEPLEEQQWGLRGSNFSSAWEHVHGDQLVPVAIIDSGIDLSHPDLQRAVGLRWNVVSDTDDVTDRCGHGTAVAGVLGADPSNDVGIRGAYPGALMIYKAFDLEQGYCASSWALVARAIRMAVDDGAKVISLSLGGRSSPQPVMNDAISYAVAADVVVVAAAGNEPCDECVLYPASDPRVVAVGCHNKLSSPCWFSSEGPQVRILAPGEEITTTRLGGGYETLSGTSLSVPFAAAAAALIRSHNPYLTRGAVMDSLEAWSQRTPGAEAGLLDAGQAVHYAPSNIAIVGMQASPGITGITASVTVAGQSLGVSPTSALTVQLFQHEGNRLIGTHEVTVATIGPGEARQLAFFFSHSLPVGIYEVEARVAIQEREATKEDNHYRIAITAITAGEVGNGFQALRNDVGGVY